MEIFYNSQSINNKIKEHKSEGKKISYVPTMGYLHQGHLSLMKKAKDLGDILVVHIFVNPAQFNDPNDLTNYPVDIDGDLKKCKSNNVDIVYIPTLEDIYPGGVPDISITIPSLMNVLCGEKRPGHFEGVLLVLSRFFHILLPDIVVMGKKDYQQFRIVDYFSKSLAFPVEIIGAETIREDDGLAMSSRNSRLNHKEREAANLIPRALKLGEKLIFEGEKNLDSLVEILSDMIGSSSLLKIDYLEFVDPETLQKKKSLDGDALLAIAVFCGSVRLIDNKYIDITN